MATESKPCVLHGFRRPDVMIEDESENLAPTLQDLDHYDEERVGENFDGDDINIDDLENNNTNTNVNTPQQ